MPVVALQSFGLVPLTIQLAGTPAGHHKQHLVARPWQFAWQCLQCLQFLGSYKAAYGLERFWTSFSCLLRLLSNDFWFLEQDHADCWAICHLEYPSFLSAAWRNGRTLGKDHMCLPITCQYQGLGKASNCDLRVPDFPWTKHIMTITVHFISNSSKGKFLGWKQLGGAMERLRSVKHDEAKDIFQRTSRDHTDWSGRCRLWL